MVLALDIGNTNIVIGCSDNGKIRFIERLSTVHTKTELEYALDIKTVLDLYDLKESDLSTGNYTIPANANTLLSPSITPPILLHRLRSLTQSVFYGHTPGLGLFTTIIRFAARLFNS